jgi:hypothetical protein
MAPESRARTSASEQYDSTPRQRADALYDWLISRNDDELPRCHTILALLPCMADPSALHRAFRHLATQRRIEQRYGTRETSRGHRIVLIVATGAILKTAGCPLTVNDPPNRAAHAVADATLRRVMEVVEDCAAQGLYLPRSERLGRRVGRSGDTARRALCELHDAGRLTLIQRGMRRAAELPDGRRTL